MSDDLDWIPAKGDRFWAVERGGYYIHSKDYVVKLIAGHRVGPFVCGRIIKKQGQIISVATPDDEPNFRLDAWRFERAEI